MIGALLGHASGAVTGWYTHVLDAILVAAADRVAGPSGAGLNDRPNRQATGTEADHCRRVTAWRQDGSV
jgi:hypothetical protein